MLFCPSSTTEFHVEMIVVRKISWQHQRLFCGLSITGNAAVWKLTAMLHRCVASSCVALRAKI